MLHPTIYLSGLLLHIYILTKLLLHATIYLLPSSLPQYLSSNPNAPESWALITGSTAGIGFGFAQELLSRGFNVVIHGKSIQELEHAQTQLRLSFPNRSIRIFQYDAASSSTTTLDAALAEVLQGISLRVLINNVGGQAGQTLFTYQRLSDFSEKEVSRVMNVNAHFMTQLTRIILPCFSSTQPTQKAKERLPCLILNISSLSATGLPYLSVYAASKAYVDAFTRSLHAEMLAEKAPVSVLGVVCGNVQSDGHRLTPGWFVPTSRAMARAALRCVGPAPPSASVPESGPASWLASAAASALGRRLGGQRALVAAYWPHAVQAWGFGILPEKAREWISISILRGLKADMEGEERRVR